MEDDYTQLSKDQLLLIIQKKNAKINKLETNINDLRASKEYFYTLNQFHMEEISRLDKEIGQFRKK
mgnify:CR=1 FL=1